MEAHFKLSDSEFEKKFTSCDMDPAIFSHEAHLRLAWLHIHQYGVDKAIENISNQLKDFVSAVGAEDKYNETLTIAAIRAVWHFKSKSHTNNFKDFIDAYPELKTDFKTLISSHYSFDVFNSEQAKKTFIEPDLQSFDIH